MSQTVQLPSQKPNKPTPPRNYTKTTEEIEIDLLKQRMYEIEKNLAALNDEMGKDNESALDKITAIRESLKILQQMIYGEPLYFLPGLGVQVRNMNAVLEQMQADEAAKINQLKGIKIALGVFGVTSFGTLATILSQIYTGS